MSEITYQVNSTTNPRLKYVDYAKALTIFLVILGHTNDLHIPGKSWLYLDFCYAFHMPLFFMLSGFFLHAKSSESKLTFGEYAKKDLCSLIIPFFIWGCIYMRFSYHNLFQLAYGSWLKLRDIQTLTSLWFLPVLFLGKSLCNAIFIFSHKRQLNPTVIGTVALPILFIVGFTLPHNNCLDGTNIGNLWGYDIAFVAAGFIMTGALLRPLFDRIARAHVGYSIALCIVSATIFFMSFMAERPLLTPGVDNAMGMCNAEYGPLGFCLVNAFSGSFALIALCIVMEKMIKDNSTLLFIGANTMGIYLIHKHIIFGLKDLAKFYGVEPNNLLIALLFSIVALLFSLLILFLVKRHAPHLLGKNIAPEKRQSVQEMFNLVFATHDKE